MNYETYENAFDRIMTTAKEDLGRLESVEHIISTSNKM